MSGHSHWSSIKHKKGMADAKKSQVFSKLAREISVAAKDGGDPDFNPKLRIAIEKAKFLNMPAGNIERAVKKGSGSLAGETLENITLEAFGPGGVALIIEGITDNKKRTLAEVKQTLDRFNGKMAGEGSVKWLFEKRGCIMTDPSSQNESFKNKENLEEAAIEAGAEDFIWKEDSLDIYTKPEELEKTKKALEEKGIRIESASLDWVAKEEISLTPEDKVAAQKLFESLDENDAVQEIYSNLKV